MRTLIAMFLCFFCTSQALCATSAKSFSSLLNSEIESEFKILAIKSIKRAYVIKALNLTDSLYYQIVSLKAGGSSHSKIKVGEVYRLVLRPYFREINMITSNRMTAVVVIDNKKIYIEGWGENTYLCDNLKGLRYNPQVDKHEDLDSNPMQIDSPKK